MAGEGSRGAGLTRRRLLQAAGVTVGVGALGAVGVGLAPDGAGSPWDPSQRRGPVFGMLQAEPDDYGDLRSAGVTAVTLSVAWSRVQPEPGRLDEDYLRRVAQTHREARRAGLDLALSPGLQYPPDWAADLPHARFVDEHGEVWRGDTGDDVLDGVFNHRVRRVQGDYLAALGERLDGAALAGIRVGGLARGELHYPPVARGATRNTLWAYSEPAQDRSPLPGWRPREGGPDDARAVVDWYLDELRDYGLWQAEVLREAFGPGPRQIVLLPSWGLRPGEVDAAVASVLDGTTSGQRRGTLTEGVDWERQLRAFAGVDGLDVCATWLDPEDQGEGPGATSPGRFLAALASQHGLAVWGENTGHNDAGELRRCVRRVRELDLAGLFWMGAEQLSRDGAASLDDYAEEIRR